MMDLHRALYKRFIYIIFFVIYIGPLFLMIVGPQENVTFRRRSNDIRLREENYMYMCVCVCVCMITIYLYYLSIIYLLFIIMLDTMYANKID